MYSNHTPFEDTTSTPKRRRLGTRILRSKNHVLHINRSEDLYNLTSSCSPINCKTPTSQRSESPHLPCNQVEFLCDSNNSSSSQIPCSPDVMDCSIRGDGKIKWESLVVSTNAIDNLCNQEGSKMDTFEEFDEISEDMFHSKLETSECIQNVDGGIEFEKNMKENINHSFDKVNQSICLADHNKTCNRSSLFETKDSFLLDIKESQVTKQYKANCNKEINTKWEGFYGLPMITKGLFKSLRNIDKFYDWQEECLNLEAIQRRQNLIYALPTSGGKTLVAEVLMLREVLLRKKNALFILPFVAIVQEKIWALSPFAVQLDFLVEEYAAGKGHIPPKKRRNKNSIYIATIEKGLALVRSLIELDRLDEIGLIVVDELHLIGEKGRGATLEILLTTVLFTNLSIQVVGMSATIGNLRELGEFLGAQVYTGHFRPVQLDERLKLGDTLHAIRWTDAGEFELEPLAQLTYDYSESAKRLDPDGLAALVWSEKEPSSCLVFCPTKKNCENVASLLCQLQPSYLQSVNAQERGALERALRAEGAAPELCRGVRHGVAFHHAGLGPDERHAVEHAFRRGVLCVLCCTSTLAAGVNLPAARVLVRAPYVGREFITLAAYRQMVGRAGRAGLCSTGTSTTVCCARAWPRLRGVLRGGLPAARSTLRGAGLAALLLGGAALRLARTRAALRSLARRTLLAVPHVHPDTPQVDIKELCDAALLSLLKSGALEPAAGESGLEAAASGDASSLGHGTVINNDTRLEVSKLAMAAIRGSMDLGAARRVLADVAAAARALVLAGSLHLLYLVTPHDGAGLRLDYRHYYSLYCSLDEDGVQTARILGITEQNAIRMVTGKPITNVSENVLCRFYLAMMLHDLWKEMPLPAVADKYQVGRGLVQSVLTSSSAFAAGAARVCGAMDALWAPAALLAELAPRLQHCAAPQLAALLALPHVRKTRALQLAKAGFRRPEDLARASPAALAGAVPHLSLRAAEHLISAARMLLIEKVENLRAEAEDVLDELKPN